MKNHQHLKKDESSEEFELIPAEKDKKKEQDEKEIRAEVTLIELEYLLKDAEENEDILYGQSQRIAFMLEDLDEKRLEEFPMSLEEFEE